MLNPVREWINCKEEELLGGSSSNARFIRGSFWLTASTLVPSVLGLAASIAVARMLHKTAYGQYGMVIYTLSVIGIFAGLGLGITSTKYISEFKAADPARASRILMLTNRLALLSGGLISLLLFIFAGLIAARLLSSPGLAFCLRLGCVLLFFNTLNGAQNGALYGLESFKAVTRVNTFQSLVNFPVTVAATYFFGLTGAVFGTVSAGFSGWLFSKLALRAEVKKAKLPPPEGKIFSELPILWKFALPALIGGSMVGPVVWLANAMLVGNPGGYGELGLVNAASQWKTMLLMLPSIFFGAALPILSSAQCSAEQTSQNLDLPQKATISIVLPLYTGAIFLGDVIMRLYGKSFAEGYPVLVGIALAACLLAFSNTGGTNLAAAGKMWLITLFNLLSGAIFIAFVYLYSGTFGARAYALGYSLSYLVYFAVICWEQRTVFLKHTTLITLLSAVYVLALTLLCLNLSVRNRIYLSLPFILLSCFTSYLFLGKYYSLRIYRSAVLLFSRGKVRRF